MSPECLVTCSHQNNMASQNKGINGALMLGQRLLSWRGGKQELAHRPMFAR